MKKDSKKEPKTSSEKPFYQNVFFHQVIFLLTAAATFMFLTFNFNLLSAPQKKNIPMQSNIAQLQPLTAAAKMPVTAVSPTVKEEQKQEDPPPPAGNQIYLPILMYHYIGNNPNPADHARDTLSITPDKFEEQMKYLSENGYTTLSLDTFYAGLLKRTTLPQKSVVLTFDDGYIDFYYNAYPVLRRLNLNATVFIITGFTGRSAYLNWDQIKEMQGSGLIHFGAHTVNHYQLTALSDEGIRFELSESKKTLERELGIPVNFIAYPYGITNGRVIQLTKEAGFVGATGTWANKYQSEGTIFNMPRLRVSGSVNMTTFIKFL